jgi:hypothetical protein
MSEAITVVVCNATQSPTYRGYEEGPLKELGPKQLQTLELQLADLSRLNETELNSELRDKLAAGDTTLPAGTLLHGTLYTPERAASMATHGVISGELFGVAEDAETHYCADFFRTEHSTSVADYSQWISEFESPTSPLRTRRMEGQRLPSPKSLLDERMGIIVDPDVPEIQYLLQADAYRPGTDELFSGIINHLPVDKNGPKAERLSAVLGGVPRGAIAGIVVSPKLAENAEHIAHIKSVFGEDLPLLTVEGQLIKGVVLKEHTGTLQTV